jgi:hypothetical protein
MEQGGQFIRLTLDVKEPVELGDFVSSFTALAAEYEAYMKEKHPDQARDATMYVKDVRHGSIIADLVTWAWHTGGNVGVVMAGVVLLDDFVERLEKRIGAYLKKGGRAEGATKQELQHFSQQVAAIANNPDSKIKCAAIEVTNGNETVRAFFEFDTSQAIEIQQRLAEHKAELDHTDRVDHARVLLRFTRTDTTSVRPAEPTGERVIIESLSPKSRKVVYASDLVERRVKHEIRDEEDNIYKKVFVVDVNVEMQNGKPYAYSIKHVHDVLPLDD